MLTGICASASFNTADIVVVVILAVGVLFGIIAGFAKMLNGSLGSILAIIISIVMAIFLADKLAGVSFLNSLTSTLEDKIGGRSPYAIAAKVQDNTIMVQSSSGRVGGDCRFRFLFSRKTRQIWRQPVLVKLCGIPLNGTNSVGYASASSSRKYALSDYHCGRYYRVRADIQPAWQR